jgi:hypothetical protein
LNEQRTMKTRTKRVILISIVSVFAAVAALVIGVGHVVRHPQSVKGLIERTLASVVHGDVTIDHIDLKTAPFRLRLTGVRVKTPSQSGRPAVSLELPELSGQFAIEGAFGQRRLVVESLNLREPSVELTGFDETSPVPGVKSSPGPFSAFLGSLFKTLVFRDVSIDHGEFTSGRLKAEMGNKRLSINALNAVFTRGGPLRVSFGADIFTADGAFVFNAPSNQWVSEAPFLSDQQPIEGILTVTGARLIRSDLNAEARGIEMKIACRRSADRLNLDLPYSRISGIRLEQNGTIFDPKQDINLTGSGQYGWSTGQLLLQKCVVEMADVLSATGSMQTQGFPSPFLMIKIDHSRILLGPLARSFAGRHLPALPSEIRLDGTIAVSGQLSTTNTSAGLQWICDLEVSSEHGVVAFSGPDLSLEGKWSGKTHAKGPITEAATTSTLMVSDVAIRKGNTHLRDLSMECALEGKYPLFKIKDLHVHFPEQERLLPIQGLEIWPVAFKSPEAVLDLRDRTVRMDTASLTSPLFGDLTLSATGSEAQMVATLRGKSLTLPQRIGLPGTILSGINMSGAGDLALKATVRWGNAIHLTGELEYGGVGFQDREGIWAGQGIKMRTGFEARWGFKDSKIEGNGWFEVPKGELLLDRFYFDMNRDRFKAAGGFVCNLTTRRANVLDTAITFGDLLAIRTDAALDWADQNHIMVLHMQLKPTPIEPLYEKFLKEPFKSEHPRLDEIRVGGLVSTDIRVASADDSRLILGQLKWDNGQLEWKKGQVQVNGIELELPLWEETGRSDKAKAPGDGLFAASFVKLPFFPAQSLKTTLLVAPNTVSIPEPISLHAEQGAIRLEGASCVDCFGATRHIRTGIEFNAIDIEPFLPLPWRNQSKAVMEGELRPVEIRSDTIQTKGRLKLQVFGGEILISDVGVEDLATPSPKIRCRIDIRDLDMSQLTEGTEFGKIEGVLEGHIENAVFSEGQPQSFDLVLETVRTTGVPQRISVEAVDNIARIGGGTSPFVGIAGVFLSLFKELPYEKIGIRARLENDVFRINGTIKEGKTEYLVKRGSLGGVDVVNQNPDNRISFKDMVKRLKRVTSASQSPRVR